VVPSTLPFDLDLQPVEEGPTYDDGLVHVTAVPNTHLSANLSYEKLPEMYPHMALQSYSYKVEVDGHRVIFSGDITTLDELNPLMAGAETLIVEVAHYDPAGIGPFVRDLPVKRVVLTHIHPGLEARMPALIEEWADPRIQIADDGLRIPLG
jgi:L-ascorbate metabolism protein UlaG (beta-lactamase superfamily)